jgi:hypothetical protein
MSTSTAAHNATLCLGPLRVFSARSGVFEAGLVSGEWVRRTRTPSGPLPYVPGDRLHE